jgi:phosphate/phosphite/phosphonate ABC transporter binding protein
VENQSTQNSDNPQQISSRSTSNAVRAIKIVLAVVLALGVLLSLYSVLKTTYLDRQVSRFFPHKRINLNEESDSMTAATSSSGVDKPIFQIAIAPIRSPEKSLEMYQDFVDYVAEKLGKQPVSLYRPTYSETTDLVRYQRCDIAIVCTYPFIRSEREFGMQALVVPQIKGGTTYRSFILVPQSSQARSLLDLRGKRFASADIISTTGWLFPAMILMDAGENPRHFFGEHIITGSHDKAIQAVADGFVDGAAVHVAAFWHPTDSGTSEYGQGFEEANHIDSSRYA